MESHNCVECGSVVAEARWALGYRECLECGEYRARQRKHTIAPLHKSAYIVITDRRDLCGINNKGGFYR